MKRLSLYGTCQAIGWSLYAVAVTLPYLSRTPLPQLAGYSTALALLGLAQTHVLRARAKRAGWDRRSVISLAFRVLVSSALMGAVMDAFMIASTVLVFSEATWTTMHVSWRLLFMSWLWWFFPVFVGWQSLYFAARFVQRARQAELEKWQLVAEANAAELRFLKAQLNPHFLFNALNGLRGLIVEDPERAQAMLTRLSTFLRSSFNAPSSTVSLESELEVVGDYLAIESVRFDERLRVKLDIDPAALEAAVPAMLVQGLVENAIKHGVALLPEGGEVSVEARASATGVEILVSNTAAPAGVHATGEGTGIANARARLRLLLGDGASLDLEQHASSRTVARVLLPRLA